MSVNEFALHFQLIYVMLRICGSNWVFNPVLIKWRHKLTLQCLKTCPQEIMCCNSTSNSRLSTVLYAHDFQCGVVGWLYPQQLYGPCLARPVPSTIVWSMLSKTSGVEQLAYLPSTPFRNGASCTKYEELLFFRPFTCSHSLEWNGPASCAYSSMQPCASHPFYTSLASFPPSLPSHAVPLEAGEGGEGGLGYKELNLVQVISAEHCTTITIYQPILMNTII